MAYRRPQSITRLLPSRLACRRPPVRSPPSAGAPLWRKILTGEATDSAHTGWSHILSFEQGTSRSSPTLEVTKTVDATSPKLELAWLKGTPFAQVDLELVKAGTRPLAFYVIRLKNATVRSYMAASADLGAKPMEAFALRFDWMRLTHVPIDAAGNPEAAVTMTWVRP